MAFGGGWAGVGMDLHKKVDTRTVRQIDRVVDKQSHRQTDRQTDR